MSRRHFEEEMRYLHEAGKEFAHAFPEQARLLNVDSVADRDPYVERLFEGFAFLTGRIRERLDDEIPQYTESLFQLLYPHFLRFFPSCSVLQLRPKPGLVQQTTVVPAGTEVYSQSVGEESVSCRFTTTQAVRLHPIRLKDAQLGWEQDGTSSLTLGFELERGVEFQKLALDPLRLYFHAEPITASLAHLFFTRHVRRVSYRAGGQTVELAGQQWVQPGGFGDDEGLLPYSKYSFPGYRLLQEYFSFRQKFWFADLRGLERLQPASNTASFEVQIVFDRLYPENKRITLEHLRLFCTPIVNLFRMDSEPVRVEHFVSEYRVAASARQPKSHRVYSVDRVLGMEEKTGARWEYLPYFQFASPHEGGRTFTTSVRQAPTGRFETYLTLQRPPRGEARGLREMLSLELTCSNASVPREKLVEGMITRPAPGTPSVYTLENLTQPTPELQPPALRHPEALWRLLSHLSLNHLSVASPEAMRAVLELYEWTGSDANRLRLAGVRDVSWAPKETFYRGAILRGAEVTVELQEENFPDEGDLCLFGLVLNEFMGLYATINSFIHLTLLLWPSGKRYEWHSKNGRQPIL